MMPTLVLTVRQPWASLLVAGIKNVENRTWTHSHRGWLWIHTSKNRADTYDPNGNRITLTESLPHIEARGAIIGAVYIEDIVRGYRSPWALPHQFHWVVTRHYALSSPVPARGRLHVWTADADVVRLLRARGGPA